LILQNLVALFMYHVGERWGSQKFGGAELCAPSIRSGGHWPKIIPLPCQIWPLWIKLCGHE